MSDCGHPNHGNPDHDCAPFLPDNVRHLRGSSADRGTASGWNPGAALLPPIGLHAIDVWVCDRCIDLQRTADEVCETEGCAFIRLSRPDLTRSTLGHLIGVTVATGGTPRG